MTHSYTLIDTFHNSCPRQANERFIAKTVKTVETPEMQTGHRVHKYIEDHINGVDPLPAWLGHLTPVLESLKARGTHAARTEFKMGVTRDLQPCGFWDPAAYIRGSIDYLLIGDDSALVVDWKTGKKKDKELQLMLYALFVFSMLPVQNVSALNYYVSEKEPFGTVYAWSRAELSEMWRGVIPLVDEIESAIETGVFRERPSGLCYGWCPVEKCSHWRPKK